MNKKILIITLCVAVSIILIGCSPNNEQVIDNTNHTTVEQTSKVTIEPVPITNNADHITIESIYPKITSFKDKEFENHINKQIASNIAEYRNEINVVVDDKTPPEKNYTYYTNYEQYLWGDYLTLVIINDYKTGGIRSNTWKDTYNINLSSERLIKLSDILPGDYEDIIVNEIMKQANQRNIKLMGGDGLKRLQTGQKFYIKDGKLVIYFDPSEVAANKYGALEFEMPFPIKEDGKFDIYATNSTNNN